MICVSNGKCVEGEAESSENKLEVENAKKMVTYEVHFSCDSPWDCLFTL